MKTVKTDPQIDRVTERLLSDARLVDHSWHELGVDSSGALVVWIWVVAPDAAASELTDDLSALAQSVESEVRTHTKYWPYVYFLSVSEKNNRDAPAAPARRAPDNYALLKQARRDLYDRCTALALALRENTAVRIAQGDVEDALRRLGVEAEKAAVEMLVDALNLR